jgi:serine/threonine protein kinase
MINDNLFIIVNGNNILELDEERKSYITFNTPFDLPYFSSPELLELKTLPAKIDYRTSYYSLGALLTYFLLNKYLFLGNEIMREKVIEKWLQPIFYTKVYWFLKRCLKEKSNERILFFI